MLDNGNQYVCGAGLTAQKQSGSWYYYLADPLGSTMAVVNASGTVQDSYTYDVYGKPTKTGSLANEFDFAGQQTDGTGLQYLRARYYDPVTGTFIARDPLSSGPAWTDSPTSYAASAPTNVTDPTGLYWGEDKVKAAKDGVGKTVDVVAAGAKKSYEFTDKWVMPAIGQCMIWGTSGGVAGAIIGGTPPGIAGAAIAGCVAGAVSSILDTGGWNNALNSCLVWGFLAALAPGDAPVKIASAGQVVLPGRCPS